MCHTDGVRLWVSSNYRLRSRMKEIRDCDKLFFDLLRVALGVQSCLSHTPSAEEWSLLYAMAKKQSLVGVCFAGVQKLASQYQAPPEMLYLQWMGMAAKIQQRNEVVNRQCVEVLERVSAEGFRSCILKGQGVAALYRDDLCGNSSNTSNFSNSSDLSKLRQSGDIDVWVEGGLSSALKLADAIGFKPMVAEHHIDLPIFEDTAVEAHFTPSYLRCPWNNKRLQAWFSVQEAVQFDNKNEEGWCVPTIEFNLVFLMLHAFRHLTSEGIGLRQVMDYYFVLCAALSQQKQEAYKVLCRLGLKRFCGAMMYVLQIVFGMERNAMLCEPNLSEGKYLLAEILSGGNFGHHDERVQVEANEGKVARYIRQTRRNIHQLSHYPAEAFFSPWWRSKVWIWRKWNGWI